MGDADVAAERHVEAVADHEDVVDVEADVLARRAHGRLDPLAEEHGGTHRGGVPLLDDGADEPDRAPGVENVVDDEHVPSLEILGQLAGDMSVREIVELTYLEDLTSERVGEVVGLAPSSVRCRLLRLRRALAAGTELGDVGEELEAAG